MKDEYALPNVVLPDNFVGLGERNESHSHLDC